jgi:hypothetical protein
MKDIKLLNIGFIIPVIILSIIFFVLSYFSGILINLYMIPTIFENETIHMTILKVIYSVVIVVLFMMASSYVPDVLKNAFKTEDRVLNSTKLVISFAFFNTQSKLRKNMEMFGNNFSKVNQKSSSNSKT